MSGVLLSGVRPGMALKDSTVINLAGIDPRIGKPRSQQRNDIEAWLPFILAKQLTGKTF